MTDEEYVDFIADEAFTRISNALSASGRDYLDETSFTHLGDDHFDWWDIYSSEFISYEKEMDGDEWHYYITYRVNMYTKSYDYWGRDEDTKEVLLSSSYEHEAKGTITVKVTRPADSCPKDPRNAFKKAEIECGTFEQVSFVDNNI